MIGQEQPAPPKSRERSGGEQERGRREEKWSGRRRGWNTRRAGVETQHLLPGEIDKAQSLLDMSGQLREGGRREQGRERQKERVHNRDRKQELQGELKMREIEKETQLFCNSLISAKVELVKIYYPLNAPLQDTHKIVQSLFLYLTFWVHEVIFIASSSKPAGLEGYIVICQHISTLKGQLVYGCILEKLPLPPSPSKPVSPPQAKVGLQPPPGQPLLPGGHSNHFLSVCRTSVHDPVEGGIETFPNHPSLKRLQVA